MEESNQILKEQIEKIPKILKNFVLSTGWKKQLEEYLVSFRLEEWQKTLIENEVFIILMGFEDYNNLSKNISEQTELEEGVSNQISEFIIKNILEPIAIEVAKEETEEVIEKPSNNIGNSFEQIILNQAIAMQPAQDASLDSASMADGSTIQSDEKRGDNDEMRIETKNTLGNVPENLPIEEVQKDVHNYSGVDPYREPVE